MIFFLILGIVLGALSMVFVLQNIGTVTVAFLDWQVTGSLALALLFAIILGIVMTLLVLLPSLIRGDFYLSAVKRQKKDLEDQLAGTRRALEAAKQEPHVETRVVEKTTQTVHAV